VATTLAADRDASERLAHVAHQVGKLEAENENLRRQLTEAQRLLSDSGHQTETLLRQLAEEVQKRARVEGERDQLRLFISRPWWRRLLG
jgi:predicted RNase H-like nuclease (RuvC/YqgF family)